MEKLIFVYNAFSGTHNAVLDSLHKLVKPKTYACSLCKVTYGVFSEKAQWKKFRKESKISMEFLHIDEFEKQYASKFGYKFTYPIVLCDYEDDLGICVTTEELDNLSSVESLIKLIQERI